MDGEEFQMHLDSAMNQDKLDELYRFLEGESFYGILANTIDAKSIDIKYKMRIFIIVKTFLYLAISRITRYQHAMNETKINFALLYDAKEMKMIKEYKYLEN